MSRRRAPRKPEPQAASLPAAPPGLSLPGGVPTAVAAAVLLLAGFGGGMIYDITPLAPILPTLFSLVAVPLCLVLIAGGLLWRMVKTKEAEAPANGPARFGGYAFLAFGVVCLLSIYCARYRFPAEAGLALAAGAIGLGSLARSAGRDERGTYALLWAHVAAAALVATLGLNEYMTNLRDGNPAWRVFGGFVNPDCLAGYLILAIPVALGLYLTATDRNLTLLAGVAFGIQLLCLLLTQSRLGLVAIALSFVVVAASAVGASRAGALAPHSRKRLLVIGVLALVIAVAGARPVIRRLGAARAESYSAQFRVLTWKGTLRMATAHPVLGTGIATFESAYPPYALVGFTRHGHSSIVQLLGETGVLGLGALLLGVGAACLAALRARRPEMRLLDGAVVAAVVGSVAHSFFDSDWHVPATAFAFALLCGLLLAASPTANDDDQATHARHPLLRWLPVLPAAYLLWFATTAAFARTTAFGAEEAIATGGSTNAVSAYEAALSATSGDVELRLRLASLYQAAGRMDDARRQYEEATRIAPIGKAYYRLARLLGAQGDSAGCVANHEKARAAEPNNLQNLLALAEAYRSAARPADADRVYDTLIALAGSDMGRVRPLPELVDWEFGEAFAARADSLLLAGKTEQAEPLLKRAAGILGSFWRSRESQMAEMRVSPEVRRRTAERYGTVLNAWIGCLERLGRQDELAAARAEQEKYAKEKEAPTTP